MTREKVKELLPVLQAYAEGRTIQIYDTMAHDWIDDTAEYKEVKFNLDSSYYRIKPEENLIVKNEEKQYRPFIDCEELIEYWCDYSGVINCSPKLFMPTIWVKHKRYGTNSLITAFDNNNESIGGACVFTQDMWIDMKELFDNFIFLDDSPIGVEV